MAAALPSGLAELAGRHRASVLAGEDGLALHPALAGLLGTPSLRRGSTLVVEGSAGGNTSLALALIAAACAGGAWVAAVELPRLGLLAACELGCSPERLVVVPDSGERYVTVVGALLDACDAVLTASPSHLEPAAARRLATRARERRSVLVVLRGTPAQAAEQDSRSQVARAVGCWQDGVDARLEVSPAPGVPAIGVPAIGGMRAGDLPDTPASGWSGLGEGCGYLRARLVEVVATRRRGAPPRVAARLWLPATDGRIAVAEPVSTAPFSTGPVSAVPLAPAPAGAPAPAPAGTVKARAAAVL